MATAPQITPPSPAGLGPGGGGVAPPQPGAGPSPAATQQLQPPAQLLAKLAMDANKIAELVPEAAPMMREVQNQVRMATMKMIQQRSAQQQASPQI